MKFQIKPHFRNFLLFFISITLVLSGCMRFGCDSDPDRYLLFDTITFIEDYYYASIENRILLESGIKGFALELAIRKVKQENEAKEKAAKEKDGDGVKTDLTANGEVSDKTSNKAENGLIPEKVDKENPTPGSNTEENEKTNDDTDQEMLRDAALGSIDELLERKAPFKVETDKNSITIIIGEKTLVLPNPKDKEDMIDLFFKGYSFIGNELKIPPTDREFFYAGIDGMVHSLDPHSAFLSPKICTQLRQETSGSFAGVGIEIGLRRNRLTVIQPIIGTPAFNAGIKSRDYISAIDGKDTLGMSLMEAVELIRGKIGTTVVLSVERKGVDKPIVIPIVRDKIDEHSVKADLLPGKIAHLRLYKFNKKTKSDLDEAIENLTKQAGGSLRGIILDMRNNPGGLLDQAVEVTDKFLDSGMIVNTMGRGMFVEKRSFASGRNTERKLPILVLINLHSASASEIVAGALQDHGRALIVGTRSFGKGSVQSIFKLPADACLRLTTALYFTPSGRSIQATGIVPDISFRYPEEEEELLLYYSESALVGHITTEKSDPHASAKVNFNVQRIFQHYEKTKQITVDQDFPEKSDWMLIFATKIMSGQDISREGMLKTGMQLLEKVPPYVPEEGENSAVVNGN